MLLRVGFIAKISILWVIGVILLVITPHSRADGHDGAHRRSLAVDAAESMTRLRLR
jgi:hypothetical protein